MASRKDLMRLAYGCLSCIHWDHDCLHPAFMDYRDDFHKEIRWIVQSPGKPSLGMRSFPTEAEALVCALERGVSGG